MDQTVKKKKKEEGGSMILQEINNQAKNVFNVHLFPHLRKSKQL